MANPIDSIMEGYVPPKTGKFGTPAKLLDNLEITESGGKNAYAVNKDTGATGSYQFMPNTVKMLAAKGIKFDPTNHAESRDAADRYIQMLVKENGGDYKKAMASYGGFVKADPKDYVAKVTDGVTFDTPKEASTGVGGGRGGQGGPTAEQNTQRTPVTEAQKLSPSAQRVSDFGKNVAEPIVAGLVKTGRSVTDNLIDWPAKKLLQATSGMSEEEAKKYVADSYKQLEDAHPTASTVGDIAGKVAQSIGLAKGASAAAGGITKLYDLGKGASLATDVATQGLAGGAGGVAREGLENKNATANTMANAGITDAMFSMIPTAVIRSGQAAVDTYVAKNIDKLRAATEDLAKTQNAKVAAINTDRAATRATVEAETLAKNRAIADETRRANAEAERNWALKDAETGAPKPTPQQPQFVKPRTTLDPMEVTPAEDWNSLKPDLFREHMAVMKRPPTSLSDFGKGDPRNFIQDVWGVAKDEAGKFFTAPTIGQSLMGAAGAAASYASDPEDFSLGKAAKAMGYGLAGFKAKTLGRLALEAPLKYPDAAAAAEQMARVGGQFVGEEASTHATGKTTPPLEEPAPEPIDTRSKIQKATDEFDAKEKARKVVSNPIDSIMGSTSSVNPIDEIMK